MTKEDRQDHPEKDSPPVQPGGLYEHCFSFFKPNTPHENQGQYTDQPHGYQGAQDIIHLLFRLPFATNFTNKQYNMQR